MPVIRLNDVTFTNLKSISTWLETETPSETVDKLVEGMMKKLGLERDFDIDVEVIKDSPASELLEFKTAPSLTFTRVTLATIGGVPIARPNWAKVLISIIAAVKSNGLSGQKLVDDLQIRSTTLDYSDKGYSYHPELGISVQGQSAADAWNEIDRLAKKWSVLVKVQFQWHEKKGAQYPGRSGVLRSGSSAT